MNASTLAQKAYAPGNSAARAPRKSEYAALARATQLLAEAESPKSLFADRIKALDTNRQVWSFFADAVADDANVLPDETRAQILSLAMFTSSHTVKVIDREAEIGPLIDINKAIMAGLRGQGGHP